jgi:hypothetical protein
MLRTILYLIVFCFGSALVAQTKTDGAALLAKEIKLSDTAIKDFAPTLNLLDQQPIPASEYGNKKEELYKQRIKANQAKKKAEMATKPSVQK